MTAEPQPTDEHDELMGQLRALPHHDVGALQAARGRSDARAAFVAEHQQAELDGYARFSALYARFMEPAWVTALCVAYLAWAFMQASMILV